MRKDVELAARSSSIVWRVTAVNFFAATIAGPGTAHIRNAKRAFATNALKKGKLTIVKGIVNIEHAAA
ncbi:MAG: hypothetical protein AAF449_12380 [Myxococcota bacterium]